MKTYYEFRMNNLMSKYHISSNAETMLKAHEDWKTGKINEAELGRLVRLSPENRSAIIKTMVKLAGIMDKKPEESKHCLSMIEICGEVVSIADKPPPTSGFPSFLRLPAEIRYRTFSYYLLPGTLHPPAIMIPYKKKGQCSCSQHDSPYPLYKRSVSLAFTSKQMRSEVMSYFYQENIIYFPCACEMGVYLRNDSFMKAHIRRVKFHWCGAEADRGIAELHSCALDSLIVVISKLTMKYPNNREKELLSYFHRASRTKTGLPESLGFEELSALQDVKEVEVQIINKRRAEVCTMAEKAELLRWLESKVKLHSQD